MSTREERKPTEFFELEGFSASFSIHRGLPLNGDFDMKKIKLLALLAALATALGVYFFFQSANKPVTESKINVVVAAADIPANTTITGEMVTMSELPTQAVLQNAVKDTTLVVGSVLNTPAVKGEQIISNRLIKTGKAGNQTLAYTVKSGMRAITIAVDNTKGISGLIKPGDSIDLIAQFQVDGKAATGNASQAGKAVPLSKIFLQKLKVLATDQNMSNDSKTNTSGYSTLTLEVTPQQAVELNYAAKNSTLQAILRSPIDDKGVQVPNITEKDVVGIN